MMTTNGMNANNSSVNNDATNINGNNAGANQQSSYQRKLDMAINNCISKAEGSIKGINPTDDDMDWNVIKDFSNPTKEEINTQLVKIPQMQAYFNNIKVYAQLVLELSEHELLTAQVQAREKFRDVNNQRIKQYEEQIASSMDKALRSTAQDKAMAIVKEVIKNLKPKEPTEKDIEAYVKGATLAQEKNVVLNRARYNKLREYCRILDNKFAAARTLSYNMEDVNKADVNVSKTSV